jgi:hypothetical protein
MVSLSLAFTERKTSFCCSWRNIAVVRKIIEDGNRVTSRIIWIPPTSLEWILTTNNVFHEHLGIKTISCRWVRHDLTDTQKQCVE